MGGRDRSGKTVTYERGRHVDDRKLATDIQSLHGLHPLQVANTSPPEYERYIFKVRERGNKEPNALSQICVYAHEHAGIGLGCVQSQQDGAVAVSCVTSKSMQIPDANSKNSTTRSDWLAWETQRMPLERAVPAFET